MKAICDKCGEPIAQSWKYCPECGSKCYT